MANKSHNQKDKSGLNTVLTKLNEGLDQGKNKTPPEKEKPQSPAKEADRPEEPVTYDTQEQSDVSASDTDHTENIPEPLEVPVQEEDPDPSKKDMPISDDEPDKKDTTVHSLRKTPNKRTPKKKPMRHNPEGEEPEPPQSHRIRAKKYSGKQRRTILLGAFVLLFVIIGFVTAIGNLIGLVGNLINATDLKRDLAQVIFPLAIIDVPEFDSAGNLDNGAVVSSAIWCFILEEPNKFKYNRDAFGSIYVPESDIELYIRRLYGADAKILHQSVTNANVQMLYNPDDKLYVIDPVPRNSPYTPRVDNIVRDGDLYTLKVSYLLPDVTWGLRNNMDRAEVDKTMEYRLLWTKDTYQILSVKRLEVTGNSSSEASQSQDNWEVSDIPDYTSSAAESSPQP